MTLKLKTLLILGCVLILAACQTEEGTQQAFSVTVPVDDTRIELATIVPTHAPTRTPTDTPTLTPTWTETETVTHTPSSTPTPTETVAPTQTQTPIPPSHTPSAEAVVSMAENINTASTDTPAMSPTYTDHYAFTRPIARASTDYVDRTYPYGDTQRGRRQVHHGVEFVNPRGTPVLAAGRGTVFYAGDDLDVLFGPENGYYGNLVVIEHGDFSPEGLPVYTLYAHLDRIEVAAGQTVTEGDQIGKVGDSGIAIGPHLHFEVRVGDPYDFGTTRNPDLWIYPWQTFGTLAGRVTDSQGKPIYGQVVEIENISNPGTIRYVYTYYDDSVNSSGAWGENFTYGDLPEGDFEVRITQDGKVIFSETISIESRKTTWMTIILDQ